MKHENGRETEQFKEKTRENRVYIKKISKKSLDNSSDLRYNKSCHCAGNAHQRLYYVEPLTTINSIGGIIYVNYTGKTC